MLKPRPLCDSQQTNNHPETLWGLGGGRQRLPLKPGVGGLLVVGVVEECFGGYSGRETPGLIPNPEAKLASADGTALGRVWESRTPPDSTFSRGPPLRGSALDCFSASGC